jgi:anti-anti-sigma factor
VSFEEHLEVQEAGGFSIVRFRHDINEVGYRAEDVFEAFRRFVSTYSCLKIAIDCSDYPYLPSSVLGLLVRLHTQEGVEVHLANAPAQVIEIIRVTRLDRMLHVNDLEIGSWNSSATGAAVSAVALAGYFAGCPSCESEHRIDKHDLGIRLTCENCLAKHTVSAAMLRDASHVYVEYPQCQSDLKIPHEDLKKVITCEHCDAAIEIRTIV